MSKTSVTKSYSKRKPVPTTDKDYENNSNCSSSSGSSNSNNNNNNNNNKPTVDLSFLNQVPKMPPKSPLRNTGSLNNLMPLISPIQTTVLQPVVDTMTITSTSQPTTIMKLQTSKQPPSIDTNFIKPYNNG